MGFVLAGLALFGGAPALAGQKWLTYGDAVETARKTNKPALVLYGYEGCPHVGPAREAFESREVEDLTNASFVLAYVDIRTPAGGRVAKRRHVDSTPTLEVLSPYAKEVWRMTSPRTGAELAAALRAVLEGKSYRQQEQLLEEGSLGPDATLALAETYLDVGRRDKGESLMRKIQADPEHFSETLRKNASFLLVEYAPRKRRLKMLREHLEVYPDNMIGLINLAYQSRTESIDIRRDAVRRVAAHLEAEPDKSLKHDGYRLVVEFGAYLDPPSAAWALPFGLQHLKFEPDEMDSLRDFAALAVVADQRAQIDAAKQLVATAAPADKVDAAIAEGIKLAEESRPAQGARAKK